MEALKKLTDSVKSGFDAVIAKIDALASSGNDGIEAGSDGKSKDGQGNGNGQSGQGSGQDGQGKGQDGQGDGSGKNGEGSGDGSGKGKGVDWGSLDKEVDGASFQKSGAFSEAGHCPADIPIDFDQFGTVSFQMKPLCDAAGKLRPLIVMFAWFISAFMVYRTISLTL